MKYNHFRPRLAARALQFRSRQAALTALYIGVVVSGAALAALVGG